MPTKTGPIRGQKMRTFLEMRALMEQRMDSALERNKYALLQLTVESLENFLSEISGLGATHVDAQYVDKHLMPHASLLLEREGYLRVSGNRVFDRDGNPMEVYEILPPLRELIDAYRRRPR